MYRLAGAGVKKLAQFFPSLVKGMPKTELAVRLGTDLLGGTITGAMTPGDLGDKLIAGATDAAAGSLGGLVAGKLGGKGALGTMADMAGSYGGAMAAMPVGDELIRMKDRLSGGKGQTGYEKAGEEQQKMMEDAIKQQVLMQYGMLNPNVGQYLV